MKKRRARTIKLVRNLQSTEPNLRVASLGFAERALINWLAAPLKRKPQITFLKRLNLTELLTNIYWPISRVITLHHFCLIAKVFPATVMVDLRAMPLGLALTEKVSDPLPTPPLSEVLITQLAGFVAAPMQVSPAATLIGPL